MSEQHFAVIPPGKWAYLLPAVMGLVMPLVLLAIIATDPPPTVQWPALALTLLVMPLVAALLGWSIYRRSVQLTDRGLRLRRWPWPKLVPYADLDIAGARMANLDENAELRPGLRIGGAQVPGFRSGWYRLRDGRFAYLLLTDRRRVVELPRRDGRLFLLSIERADAFLRALRQQAI